MTATATYNRKMKQWEVTANGRLLSAHPAGQQEAEQAAIQHNDPVIYGLAFYLAHDLFRGYPELNGRLWRAAEIVINGDVREPYHFNESRYTISRVKKTDPAPYEMTGNHSRHYFINRSDSGLYSCDCYDYINDHAPRIQGQKLCKHILAVKLMKLAERPFGAWPEKELDERDQWLADYRKRQEENGQRLTAEEMERQLAEKRENMRRWRHNRAMQEAQRLHELKTYTTADVNADLFA